MKLIRPDVPGVVTNTNHGRMYSLANSQMKQYHAGTFSAAVSRNGRLEPRLKLFPPLPAASNESSVALSSTEFNPNTSLEVSVKVEPCGQDQRWTI